MISYTQKTWKAASGEPMHAESGYWRPRPDGSVEVVIAQSTGLAEVQVRSYFLPVEFLQAYISSDARLGIVFIAAAANTSVYLVLIGIDHRNPRVLFTR